MHTAADLTPEEFERYRAAARRRAEEDRAALRAREVRAWEHAREAAALLRGRFGAERVAVFGSLVHEGAFTEWSDVDIAVWGLRPEDTFRALGAVMDLSAEIELSMVDMAMCRPTIAAVIERVG